MIHWLLIDNPFKSRILKTFLKINTKVNNEFARLLESLVEMSQCVGGVRVDPTGASGSAVAAWSELPPRKIYRGLNIEYTQVSFLFEKLFASQTIFYCDRVQFFFSFNAMQCAFGHAHKQKRRGKTINETQTQNNFKDNHLSS